ncbi:pilus assembly protein PilY [Rhodanobacter sp. DHB23]|nr:pilus assembly protein PilY [Rhodanobacter sp. DHB23]
MASGGGLSPAMAALAAASPASSSSSSPASSSSSSTVTVDQQPVTVQPTIPPDIVLMLDDSGSMAWDYMPDWGYMTSSSGNGSPSNDQARNSAINGVYYNPNITYTPPPKADSTATTPDLYPNSPGLTNAYADGFTNTNATDITKYKSPSENFPYYTRFLVTVVTTYAATGTTIYAACPNGTTTVGSNPPQCYSCPSGYSLHSSSGSYTCKKSGSSNQSPTITTPTSSTTYSCNSGDTLSGTTCSHSGQVYKYYFTYTTGSANTEYYVGATGTCALLSTASPAVSTSLCDETATTQQNVANWFSYYSTRIRMAKSGLMTAFSTVSKDFRVGFGSIDGGCNGDASNLPSTASSSAYSYTDSYDCGNGGSTTNYIAFVQPFGDGSSSTDQKNGFWNWAAALSPSGGTPLRMALSEVGHYYQTSQPWTTMSSDPNAGTQNPPSNIACRQAYTILTTDGFWNESYSLSDSSTISGASNAVWPSISGPNGQSWPATANSKPPAPYSGGLTSSSNGPSLADVALYYWENDLQTGFSNEVPTSTQDPAFWQHMVTFTMGLGFTPTGITPTTATTQQIFNWAAGGTAISNFSWPTPSPSNNGSINNIADLEHAGVNGHGGFYSATSPQTFASGLTDALNRAAERVGTGASLAANSTQLTNGTVAYQANYYTVKWTGDLKALSINSSTGAISTTPTWSAVTELATLGSTSGSVTTYGSRKIYTYNPSAASGSQFPAFKSSGTTPPSLSSTELSALGSSATAQAAMVNYLRGDNTQEEANSGAFRTRTTPLGDIVDSQPVYSGVPNPNEFENQVFTGMSNTATTGDNSFQGFAVGTTNATTGVSTPSSASTRTALVFVAANDGMLHAFNASTGVEVYAYLPGAVITAGLSNLSDPTYGSSTTTTAPHQYYNDGELTIADAYFGSAWHTVLVGTTGRGLAKAVYALDITNPNSITPLWERSAGDGDTNSGYIGQMVGKPVIAQVADGNWQVLIGNGYNSANGTAALLEFELDNGTLNVHTTDSTAANGLAAPVAWMDNPAKGISTKAYAGDLAGRVWEFTLDDVANTTTGTPPDTTTTTTYTVDLTAAGVKEFTATDPSGNAQPITGGMLAGSDPTTGNVWVFFGTGQYLSSGDLTNDQVQSWYGLIVEPGSNPSTLPSLPTTTSSGNMVQRYITYEQDGDPSANPPTVGVRLVSTLPTPSDMTGKLGWYMNLEQPVTDSNGDLTGGNAQGERMVTPNQFEGNLLLGTTRIPAAAANADICNSSGSGWVMAVDPFTGTNPTGAFFLPNGSSGTVTVKIGGKTVTEAVAGVGFSSLPNNPIFVGSDMLMSFDNGSTSSLSTSGAMGIPQRVSWQELVNP